MGTLIPDLMSHIAQMTGYLSHTGLRLGLLLNFKHAKLQWKRIVN
jgi:GxxExxY protein